MATNSNLNNMKSQTFGVEVEMNSITREEASKIAADFFGTNRYQNTALRNGYYTWSAWDSQGREWKFQRDVSIHGIDSEKCELVTPILHYEDIETLQELVRRLRKAGAKSDASRGCGIHIHIGADGHTPKTIKNLVNMMAKHEGLLIKALKIDRERIGSYCRMVDKRFVDAINDKCPKTMEQLADMWYTTNGATCGRNEHYNNSRYHMLNLHATFTKGTIEFRLFQFDTPTLGKDGKMHGGIHAGQLKAYIQLCLAMSNRAKELPRTFAKVHEIEDKNMAQFMRRWMNTLGMYDDREEFETARTIFTRNLTVKALRGSQVA